MAVTRRALLTRIASAAAFGSTARPLVSAGAVPAGIWSAPVATNGPVRLHTNENAYGPSPRAVAAAHEAVRNLHHYPDAESERLRSRIAQLHQVSPAQVVLGCGSRQILRMAVDAFAGANRKVVVARPTFDWMCGYADGAATVTAIPLTADYSHDLTGMHVACQGGAGLVYICNPNNPTGTLTRRRDVETFIRDLPRSTYVLVDEAYHHYAGESSDYASFIDRPVDDPRVIVSRTFSKAFGLAGLRIGYAITAIETARVLQLAQPGNNVNAVGTMAALAAVEDTEHVRTCVARNSDDLQEFMNQANARMQRVVDSQTNCVMVNTGVPASRVVDLFARNQILIAGPFPGFDDYIRVSLGTVAQMRQFWSVWDRMPAHHMM